MLISKNAKSKIKSLSGKCTGFEYHPFYKARDICRWAQ